MAAMPPYLPLTYKAEKAAQLLDARDTLTSEIMLQTYHALSEFCGTAKVVFNPDLERNFAISHHNANAGILNVIAHLAVIVTDHFKDCLNMWPISLFWCCTFQIFLKSM